MRSDYLTSFASRVSSSGIFALRRVVVVTVGSFELVVLFLSDNFIGASITAASRTVSHDSFLSIYYNSTE